MLIIIIKIIYFITDNMDPFQLNNIVQHYVTVKYLFINVETFFYTCVFFFMPLVAYGTSKTDFITSVAASSSSFITRKL